jgi:clan AA aspartic protease (TIGR02281 family)
MAGSLRTRVLNAVLFSTSLFGVTVFAGTASAAPPDSDKAKTPEAVAHAKLSEKGVRATHSGLSLLDEKELGRALNEVNILRRKLITAAKDLKAAQQDIDQRQQDLTVHQRDSIALNAQLANVPRSNPVEHNQLVGAVNVNSSEINLLREEQEQAKKNVDAVRKKSNTARESFVQQLAETRALVDRLSERYTTLKADADVQRALAEWNTAANRSFELKPSPYFLNAVTKLEALEKTVQTEKIPLRREGNSLFATVVINGKPPEDMIVDTGASMVVLPYKVAVECGAKPDESSLPMVATVADGSQVNSKQVVLDSMRIGDSKAEHVVCAVLPPEAKNALPLLGMTFLSRFNVALNGNELVLTKIEGDHVAAKPKKTRASKSTRKPRKTDSSTDSDRQ